METEKFFVFLSIFLLILLLFFLRHGCFDFFLMKNREEKYYNLKRAAGGICVKGSVYSHQIWIHIFWTNLFALIYMWFCGWERECSCERARARACVYILRGCFAWCRDGLWWRMKAILCHLFKYTCARLSAELVNWTKTDGANRNRA